MKNLPVESRASQALVAMGAPTIEALIAKMETFRPVSELSITDKDSFTPVWESLKVVREIRKDITTKGKAARDDANAHAKAVIAAEKALIAVIDPVETILKEKTDAWKQAEEERKAAKRERLQRIEVAVGAIRSLPGTLLNSTSTEMQAAHDSLKDRDLEDEGSFGEFIEKAKEEKSKALEALKTAIDRAAAQEEQARKLAEMQAQQAEFERQKAEFAEQQRQAELAKQAAENARLQAEKDKAEAEAKALRDAEAKRKQEEAARIAEEEKAQAEKEEAARQAALAPDKEKLIALADSLASIAVDSANNKIALVQPEAIEMLKKVGISISNLAAQIKERAEKL